MTMKSLVSIVLVALLLSCSGPILANQQESAQPVGSYSKQAFVSLNQASWSDETRQRWYHTSAGTQMLPYEWFLALDDEPLKNNFSRTGVLPDPEHPDRLPVGFTRMEGPNVRTPQVGLTCSFCHTAQFTYRGETVRIEGGPSLQYNARFLQALLEALGELQNPQKGNKFVQRLREKNPVLTAEELADLPNRIKKVTGELISRGAKDASPFSWGPGRFDALGRGGNLVFGHLHSDNLRPANAAVSIPALWGVWEYDWVQWSGSIQHPLARNIAQVIGVNAGLFAWNTDSSPPPADDAEKFRSSVDVPLLKELEKLARTLRPPRWPKIFPPIKGDLAIKGRELYHGKKKEIPNLCAHCHVAKPINDPHPSGPSLQVTMIPQNEVGTDPLYLENFSKRSVDIGPLGRDRLSAREASQMLTTELMKLAQAEDDPEYRHLSNHWRDLPQYIARPHLAVWATAPFLHNGSVPNLYELLSPADERHTCFVLSPTMEFDPEKVGYVVAECAGSPTFRDPLGAFEFRTQFPGNGNRGHEFNGNVDCRQRSDEVGFNDCRLSVPDRLAIVEYLKTCDLDQLVLKDSPPCRDLE